MTETLRTLKTGEEGGKIQSQVFEAISKCVEFKLRETVERFSGWSLTPGSRDASDVIDAAIKSGLLETDVSGNPDRLHFLLRWYFGERNPSHHEYPEYDLATFLNYFMIGNFMIREFENRRNRNPLRIAMEVTINPPEVPLGTFYHIAAKITRPDGTFFESGAVKAIITYNGRMTFTEPLVYSVGSRQWTKDVATSVASTGDFYIRILAIEGTNKFVSERDAKGRLTGWVP